LAAIAVMRRPGSRSLKTAKRLTSSSSRIRASWVGGVGITVPFAEGQACFLKYLLRVGNPQPDRGGRPGNAPSPDPGDSAVASAVAGKRPHVPQRAVGDRGGRAA